MINATVIGRLGKDPEAKNTTTGKKYAAFSIASDNRTKDADGGKTTTWVNVKAWGPLADIASEYLAKGSQCACMGPLELRKWTDKEGVTRESLDLNANDIQLLSSKDDRPRDDDAPTTRPKASKPASDDYDPFAEA